MTNTDCSESKICCEIRCLDSASVEAAKRRLDPAGMQRVPYTCKISGKEEELLLVGNELASRLSQVVPEAEDADGARILAGLYSAELCECDVATLTGLPEHEVIRRLRAYTERGVLAHRTLHNMNYFRLASEKVRCAIDDAVTALKGLE